MDPIDKHNQSIDEFNRRVDEINSEQVTLDRFCQVIALIRDLVITAFLLVIIFNVT